MGGTTLALDRSLPTFTGDWSADAECTAKKIVDTVCEVEETVKGTSENAECSNRGNCDSQTGLCTSLPDTLVRTAPCRLCWSKKRREISLNNLDLLVKTVALHKERETRILRRRQMLA